MLLRLPLGRTRLTLLWGDDLDLVFVVGGWLDGLLHRIAVFVVVVLNDASGGSDGWRLW